MESVSNSSGVARDQQEEATVATTGDCSQLSKGGTQDSQAPRVLALAQAGVTTGHEFAGMMSALMSDVIEGRVAPQVANAVVNAGGKLLKVVEMQIRYGKTVGNDKVLTLTHESR